MSSKLAIVPARAGSKRLPNKNMKPLGGKPLIAWSVQALIDSNCFDTIVVNTDSQAIEGYVNKNFDNVKLYRRPNNLGSDTATALEVVLEMMKPEWRHNIVGYFLPTCPFIRPESIQDMVNLNNCDSKVGVVEYSEAPQLAMIPTSDLVTPVFDNLRIGVTNSRFYTKYVKPCGSYITTWDHLEKAKSFFQGRIGYTAITKTCAFDIDDEFDLFVAEQMINKNIVIE